jgi:hypothetical protein
MISISRSVGRAVGQAGVPMWAVAPAVIVLVFWLTGDAAGWFLIPYLALWLASTGSLPHMYGSLEATELMLSLGCRRSDLARVYLQRIAGSGALHALAFTIAWTLRGFDGAWSLGLAGPGLFFKLFACIFSMQLLARSLCLIMINAPVATCFSPRWRGCWTGDGRSFWRVLGTAGACLVVVGSPIAVVTWSIVAQEPMWIVLPALIYFLALALLVRTTEIASVLFSWQAPVSTRRRRFPSRTRPGALRALGWHGLSRWVWASGALLLTPGLAILFVTYAVAGSNDGDEYLLVRGLWFGFAGWFVLLLIAGGKMFIWSSLGDSGETLRMAGLQPAYLRRFKLLVAAAILLGACGLAAIPFTGASTLGFRDDVAHFFTRSLGGFVVLAGAAHLLLWMNEGPVFAWKGRTFHGYEVAKAARAVICLVIVFVLVVERILKRDLEGGTAAPWPSYAGLALLASALILWIVGWVRAAERD